jgi:hypothetical protein
VNENEKSRISIKKFRELTSDYKSSEEEVQEIINSIYILSHIMCNTKLNE